MTTEKETIMHIIEELKIPADREIELRKIYTEAKDNQSSSPVDDVKFFIRSVKKANELAFLTFLYGISVGQGLVVEHLPGMLNKAVNIGAQIAMQEAGSGEAPPAMTAEQKKKEKQEEIMYQ